MKSKHGKIKRAVILLWSFVISGLLFYFSLASSATTSQGSEVFFTYFNFTIILFGSGLAYHVIVLLLKIPQNNDNIHMWKDILIVLFLALVGYVVVLITVSLGVL